MDVMLQRHCAKYIYVIPEGLRELMSDISREVLRSQPEEIYSFIADYLDALLITRENARVAARFVESITEISTTIADLLIRTGMTREEADKVATVIQIAFRNHFAEKTARMRQQMQVSDAVEEANIITEIIDEAGITPEQAEQAVLIIQNAYRNFKHRQERETDLLKGMVDWRVAARSTMRLYRKLGVTYEEANRAATLIKAAYKGYYTRRIMKRLLEESDRVSEEAARSVEEESYGEYPSYWDRFGAEEEEASYAHNIGIFEDIEAVKKEEAEALPEPEEDTETMVVHIVDSLLKQVVPGSSTTVPSGFGTPPPSAIESETKIMPSEGVTIEASPETVETEVASPEEAAEAPATEVVEVADKPAGVPTEVIMPPETDEADTDTDYNDTNASEMQTTETDTTTEDA